MRKIIFKDMCGLSTLEKLRVVGEFVGKSKRITEDNIYETMLSINDEGKKITVSLISKVLKCSTRTIYRNMSEDLKREKELLNKEL
jgi:ribosomal protein L28